VLVDAMIDGECECLSELRRKLDASAVLRPPRLLSPRGPPFLYHDSRHTPFWTLQYAQVKFAQTFGLYRYSYAFIAEVPRY
jgi:hypothetical protein